MSDASTKKAKSKSVAKQLAELAAMPDSEIDTSDIPETKDWSGAETSKFYRPVKKQVTLRIDAEVLAWFRSKGGKYQTAINQVLREHVARARRGQDRGK